MTAPTLRIKGVSKKFGDNEVLHDVSIDMHGGEVVGLVGVNGAGKSTLMNIIAGEVWPDEGELEIEGRPAHICSPRDAERHGIALMHQEPVDFAHMSVAENIFLQDLPTTRGVGFTRTRFMERKAMEHLARLGSGLSPRTRISELSIGGRQQVAVARALARNAKIILFDEPTSSLSLKEKQLLFEVIARLKSEGAAIIYITHFLDEVLQVCDRVCVLRDGRVSASGPVQEFSLQDIIREMVGHEVAASQMRRPDTSNETLFEVKGIRSAAPLRNISFTVRVGEVVGLWGLMGSGRTELVRALLGLDQIDGGSILLRAGGALKPVAPQQLLQTCGYVTESRHEDGLFLPQSVWWNISSASMKSFVKRPFYAMDVKRELEATKEMTEALQIRLPGPGVSLRKLSGGNQQKVVLAKWLQRHPVLYFLDEPTRGVDVGAKAEIKRIIRDLAAQGAGVLLISSEIEEIMAISDRILVLRAGELVQEVPFEMISKEYLMTLSVGGVNG